MEFYFIEFCGELSDTYKKNYLLKTAKMLWIMVLFAFTFIGLPLIIIGIIFLPLYVVIPFTVVFVFVCLAVPVAVPKSNSLLSSLPVKVIIENGEIAALNSDQVSKLNLQSGGIDSLNIDGYFITNIKPVSEIVKVVDYGEWYGIYFNSRHIFTDYICQKNLITKGTIEDFEKLFEGKIVRKNKKE